MGLQVSRAPALSIPEPARNTEIRSLATPAFDTSARISMRISVPRTSAKYEQFTSNREAVSVSQFGFPVCCSAANTAP